MQGLIDKNANNPAKQVQVIDKVGGSYDASGFYLAPSTDVSNVFTRYDVQAQLPNGGYLFQLTDNSWMICQNDFTPMYVGDKTISGSHPPTVGWRDIVGNLVELTLVYYDKDVTSERYGFATFDISHNNTLRFEYTYPSVGTYSEANALQSATQAAYISARLEQHYAYEKVIFSSNSFTSTCQDEAKASYICRGFGGYNGLEDIQCTDPDPTNWFIQTCDNSNSSVGIQSMTLVVGNDNDGNDDTALAAAVCGCENTQAYPISVWSPFSGNTWGSGSVPASTTGCGDSTSGTSIVFQCQVYDTCTDLSASCENVVTEVARAANDSSCMIGAGGTLSSLEFCALTYFFEVGDCCQQAIRLAQLDTSAIACSTLTTTITGISWGFFCLFACFCAFFCFAIF